jgi:hypothetical protein
VIGAAHVAAALIRLYQAADDDPQRVRDLAAYGTGCLELAGAAAGLTDTGITIARQLKEAF